MRRAAIVAVLAASLAAGARVAAAGEVPAWVHAAAERPDPAGTAAGAVVLFHEQRIDWTKPERRVVTTRRVLRIRNTEGRGFARASLGYCVDTDKVRGMRAWVLSPSGSATEYGKDHLIDRALLDGALYSEIRLQVLTPTLDVLPGEVFASETVLEDRTPCGQAEWDFQEEIPTLVSRLAIEMPPGWRAEATTFNRPALAPVAEGAARVWEARDLPAFPDEAASPPAESLVPRVGVTCVPPDGGAADPSASFRSWSELSRWIASLMDPMSAADDSIARTARRLVAGSATRADSVRAIARYVQRLQYAALQLGLRKSGGARPRPARQVLATGYGDCKDKASLMRSLLAAVGVPAVPIIVSASDPDRVRSEWPSPQPFDHCILGVSLPSSGDSYPLLRGPHTGSLVVFDPTDPYTAFGDLPAGEQGGLALPVSAGGEDLVRLPVLPVERRREDRRLDLSLGSEGSLAGRIEERAWGQAGRSRMMEAGGTSATRAQRWAETWLARSLGGATVSEASLVMDSARGSCAWNVRFQAPRYAQVLSDRMLVLRPFFLGAGARGPCDGETRTLPIRLEAEAYRESVTMRLPPGFAVEDLPAPTRVESPFGRFEATAEVKEGVFLAVRSIEIPPARVEADQCGQLKSFFDRVRAAERATLVVSRAP